jgi:opacity protein-like surface antigen
MNDKDFDDIGKRLHDLEADPPKDGWEHIAPVVRTPSPGGKMVWLRKHGWKPLVLLIPISSYLLFFGIPGNQQDLTSTPASNLSAIKPTPGESSPEPVKNTNSDDTAQKQPLSTDITAVPHEAAPVSPRKRSPRDADNLAASDGSTTDTALTPTVSGNSTVDIGRESEVHPKTAPATPPDAPSVDGVSRDSRGSDSGEKITSKETSTDPEKSGDASSTSTLQSTAPRHANNLAAIPAVQTVVPAAPGDDVANDGTPATAVTLRSSEGPVGTPDSVRSIQAISADKSLATDSASSSKSGIVVIESDEGKDEKKEKSWRPWRLTAAVTPQYLTRAVKPVVSDEVLVTNIEKSSLQQRIGFGFALGGGKAITDNIYLDGQISYSELHQDTYLAYATGKVDTLIAIQGPDESVRIVPIYEVANREISSKYGYGGITLSGTYYFWSTARRRFNFSAGIGAHFLLTETTREKLKGNWIPLNNESTNSTNYSFRIGAGYNINLNKGWELMINPTLTYYLRQVKSDRLPYNADQQSAGLNIMLSKTLGGN